MLKAICRVVALAVLAMLVTAPAWAQGNAEGVAPVVAEIDQGTQVAQAGKANPCAAKQPCAPKQPCAAAGKVDPKLVTRPKGTKLVLGDKVLGERLWKDVKLSTNGLSCATCHAGNANFNPSFAKPYPHPVAMAEKRGGVKQVNVDEMVQFCMVVPMTAKPLAWDSKELAALSAYVLDLQKGFKPGKSQANPCAAKNPCAPKK